jgi:hypothetical protein
MAKRVVLVIILGVVILAGLSRLLPSDSPFSLAWLSWTNGGSLSDKQTELFNAKSELKALDEAALEATADVQAAAGTCPITGKPNQVVSVEIVDDPRPALRKRIAQLEREIGAQPAK